jgi:hypothetical protein
MAETEPRSPAQRTKSSLTGKTETQRSPPVIDESPNTTGALVVDLAAAPAIAHNAGLSQNVTSDRH